MDHSILGLILYGTVIQTGLSTQGIIIWDLGSGNCSAGLRKYMIYRVLALFGNGLFSPSWGCLGLAAFHYRISVSRPSRRNEGPILGGCIGISDGIISFGTQLATEPKLPLIPKTLHPNPCVPEPRAFNLNPSTLVPNLNPLKS